MSHTRTYANVPGLDLTVEREKIDFHIIREAQTSETYQFVSCFNQMVIRDPNNAGKILRIGEVPATRPYLPYAETMDWILKEFDERFEKSFASEKWTYWASGELSKKVKEMGTT